VTFQPAQADFGAGEHLKVLLGDCMARLPELPDESVDCAITSVPYYRAKFFPGATTVFGGDRHCIHDWHISRVLRRDDFK
jgi:hypothetical protein